MICNKTSKISISKPQNNTNITQTLINIRIHKTNCNNQSKISTVKRLKLEKN